MTGICDRKFSYNTVRLKVGTIIIKQFTAAWYINNVCKYANLFKIIITIANTSV